MRDEIRNKITKAPLSQVDLGEMRIKDEELEEIVSLIIETRPSLVEIFLNNNGITDVGADILGKKLPAFSKLSVLDLQFNQIDKKGAIAVFGLRALNPNLQILFHGNKITNEAQMEEISRNAVQK